MKTNILTLTLSLALVIQLSCQESTKNKSSNGLDSQGEWSVAVYVDSTGNNIPRSALSLGKGGFVVLGQKHTKTDSVTHSCSLVRLDNRGKVIREVVFGT